MNGDMVVRWRTGLDFQKCLSVVLSPSLRLTANDHLTANNLQSTKRIIKRRRLELSEFQFRTGQSDYRLNALPRAIELDALTVFTIHGWPSYGFIGWGVVGGGRHGKGSCRKCRVWTAVGFLKSTQRVTMIEMRSDLCGLCLWAVGDRIGIYCISR